MNPNAARRIVSGNTVRIVNDVFGTETVGTLIFDETQSSRRIREGDYGMWTIRDLDGIRCRSEGRIYRHD